MDIKIGYKQLSELEQAQVESDIEKELIEHLYKAARPGSITAFLTSIVVFILFYNYTNFSYLVDWFIGFNLTLLLVVILDIYYRKFKDKIDIQTWGFAHSFLIVLCTAFWGSCIFFDPHDFVHQFILLALLCMVASSFSMVTVGMFKLCIVCIGFVLLPVASWFFFQHDLYYKLGGAIIFCYFIFLIGMNRRSTEWFRNSLKLSKMLASFTHQANHDLLTDLPNQRLLVELLEESINKAKSNQHSFGVVSFAINRLESFNNFGYQTSDLIIQALAKRLKSLLENLDRLDGGKTRYTLTLPRSDAFTIIIEPLKLEAIEEKTSQFLAALDSPFSLGKREAKISGSLGVSLYPKDGDSVRTLLSNAYAAMFQAKQRGGSQIEIYQPKFNAVGPSLLELENDLYHALERKELLVYYQPLVDLNIGKICGMEALIRWKHPKRGMVSPVDFIPLAEETGLINPIGEWILKEACTQTVLWQQQGFNLKVAVNLSAKQLWKGNLPTIIDRILEKTHISPQFLELELTETQILDENLVPLIREITNKGISLSIDDFGTGYSGLSYLKFFDVGKIKIDRSFIQDVTSNNNSATIVSAILGMAKELGIKTLAEGVETKEQLEFLRERGCQFIQGFYFSKPLSAEDFTELLRNPKF